MAKGEVFLMTDKSETKDVPCTYTGCTNICRVNKFYTPSKARCPEHKGKKGRTMTGSVAQGFTEFTPTKVDEIEVEVTPNTQLRHLCCPVCDTNEPLEILGITETGHIDFGCQRCQTITSITFNFRSAQMRSVPERLQEVVKLFNIRQVGSMDPSLARQLAATKFSGLVEA